MSEPANVAARIKDLRERIELLQQAVDATEPGVAYTPSPVLPPTDRSD